MYTGFWWGKPEGRDHLEDQGVDWRMMLRSYFRKLDEGNDFYYMFNIIKFKNQEAIKT